MFSFGKQKQQIKQLEDTIGAVLNRFEASVATAAALLSKNVPEPGDRYLAILLGFSDAVGQMADIDTETTKKALRQFMSDEETFQYTMSILNNPSFHMWRLKGGQAAIDTYNSNGDKGPMLKLAREYLL